MKLLLGVLLTFAVAVYGQDGTVTDGLLSAQDDLALGHEFFETLLYINRGQVSSYLQLINREIIESHINTYQYVKELGLNTLAEFERIERTVQNTQCLDSILNRWDLQTIRYGHRLATCVNGAYRLINEWNSFLNNIHETAQSAGSQVQNLGVKILAETPIFDGRDSLPDMVNREFRMLLGRILPYRTIFDNFLQEVSSEIRDTIQDLISCDETLEEDFAAEVTRDLTRGRNCATL